MIKVEQVNKAYSGLQVLKDIRLHIQPQELVALTGPSGAGKTTLLQIIGSLEKADSGKVVVNGVDIASLGPKSLAEFRNKEIGFVFQSHNLLPEFTALENLLIPALIARTSKNQAVKRAEELLEFFHLRDRATHKPAELSGGEQQRIAVARAFMNHPSIVLADEPSGNLDSANAKALHSLFFSLREEFKQTFLIVTHNEELAKISDREIRMQDGTILND